jgi:hypothetical protein
MKVYNLQYHLLHACNPDPITSPVTTLQGAHSFDKLNGIMNVQFSNPQLVGGIRMEIRIHMTHVMDAVNYLLKRQFFNPQQLGVNVRYTKVPIQRYIIYAQRMFHTARELLNHADVMRHAAARDMTTLEKPMFGDLKLLLGYRHAGYHTEVRRKNPWWLQHAPTANQPPQQANRNPPPQSPPQDRRSSTWIS